VAPAGGLLRLRSDERGLTSVGILMAVAFTLIVAVTVLNMFLYLYGQGAVRAAIDEGARAGSRVGAGPAVCQARAAEVLTSLMPGPLGDEVTIACRPGVATGELVAVADATFRSPLPGVPAWTVRMVARATQETGE